MLSLQANVKAGLDGTGQFSKPFRRHIYHCKPPKWQVHPAGKHRSISKQDDTVFPQQAQVLELTKFIWIVNLCL